MSSFQWWECFNVVLQRYLLLLKNRYAFGFFEGRVIKVPVRKLVEYYTLEQSYIYFCLMCACKSLSVLTVKYSFC